MHEERGASACSAPANADRPFGRRPGARQHAIGVCVSAANVFWLPGTRTRRGGVAFALLTGLALLGPYPLTVSGPLGMVSELGSPAASVWLFAPCRLMIWGVLPPVSSGAPDR